MFCISIHVGSEAEQHCLSGSARIISITSVCVTGVKRRSSQPTGAAVNCGSAAPEVAARTPATLSSKNRRRTVASMSACCVRPRPSLYQNQCRIGTLDRSLDSADHDFRVIARNPLHVLHPLLHRAKELCTIYVNLPAH